ncbi:unnamed protein product [Cylicocyclus nassatus]|uniref:Helicase C-terminal domain-containing protein n=1 Tax=Cylicocyclus nassatus TaxID=53992 RepID=A0AA36HD00_CYLNA|nr:unnamed protein product [Cylicocyclus nassatus]
MTFRQITSSTEQFVFHAVINYLDSILTHLGSMLSHYVLASIGIKDIDSTFNTAIRVYHSGLLPILKKTVEIFFGKELLKTLFATETFSLGLDMPARTVLLMSARKFDGADNRWITSGEYIRMSGRAGLRGKDDRGFVILMVDHKMSSEDAKQITKVCSDLFGESSCKGSTKLTFSSYNMVLNLLRVEGVNPELMLERSFYQFQNYDPSQVLRRVGFMRLIYFNLSVFPATQEKAIEIENMHLELERDITAFFNMEKQVFMGFSSDSIDENHSLAELQPISERSM